MQLDLLVKCDKQTWSKVLGTIFLYHFTNNVGHIIWENTRKTPSLPTVFLSISLNKLPALLDARAEFFVCVLEGWRQEKLLLSKKELYFQKLFILITLQFQKNHEIFKLQDYNYSIAYAPSKCLVWVKKCCRIWLDQNFDPFLLTNKLWRVFMRIKQKNLHFGQKQPKNAFACFWDYVGQPHNHISWATPMQCPSDRSIYLTNQRTNPWNFQKNFEN